MKEGLTDNKEGVRKSDISPQSLFDLKLVLQQVMND